MIPSALFDHRRCGHEKVCYICVAQSNRILGTRKGVIFLCLPGTYSSSWLRQNSETYRAIFSRPAQAGLTTAAYSFALHVLCSLRAKRLVSMTDRQF